MAAALQIHVSGIKLPVSFSPITKQTCRFSKSPGRIRCAATTTPNKQYTIAVLPGDGIGTEVTPIAVDVLRLAGSLEGIEFEIKEMLVGGAAYEATGVPLSEETLKASLECDAVYLGAVGATKKMPSSDHLPKHLRPEAGLISIRRALGVYANLRPITVFPQLLEASPLKRSVAEGVDLMIVRELVGGLYNGKPRGFGVNEKGEETGFCTEIYSKSEVDRVARIAFDMAMQRRGKVCSVDKANVLESSMLWRRRVTIMSGEYPEVDLSHLLVDTSGMELIRYPKQFDVLLTTNVFGDILSDRFAIDVILYHLLHPARFSVLNISSSVPGNLRRMPISYSNSSFSQCSVDPAIALADGDFGIPKKCFCGSLMRVEVSTNNVNRGKKYFGCPTSEDPGEHIFKWWDVAVEEELDLLHIELRGKQDRQIRLPRWGEYHAESSADAAPQPSLDALKGVVEETVDDVTRMQAEVNRLGREMEQLKEFVANRSDSFLVVLFVIVVVLIAYLLK